MLVRDCSVKLWWKHKTAVVFLWVALREAHWAEMAQLLFVRRDIWVSKTCPLSLFT